MKQSGSSSKTHLFRYKFVLLISIFFLLSSNFLKAQTTLSEIEAEIQQYINEEEALGLELSVFGKSGLVYQNVWGWKDRDANIQLKPGMVYNVRSMTKPMIGTLIHIFIERGKLDLDDKVSKYLDSFDNDVCQDLTIRQMLLHRAGYVQGMPGKSWTQYSSLKQMVDYWGKNGPQNPGNTNWSYADAHADIAARVLEKISGKSLRSLIREELITPLDLSNTYTAWSDDIDQSVIMPLYKGTTGNWSLLWRPTHGKFYDFGMGAQSLFTTSEDYASYMQIYLNHGRLDKQRIISPEGVRSTYQNRDPIQVPQGFFPLADGNTLSYGHFWGMINNADHTVDDPPAIFMHQGSDGTAAYAFTDENLIVTVLTQSRGTNILPMVESLIKPLIDNLK